jgi:DNA-binding NarL/FixJ family response regulator
LARTPPGAPFRLDAITVRVFLDIDHGEEVVARALAEAADDQWWRGRLLELLGWLVTTYRGELAAGGELGEQALAIAAEEGDRDLEMLASATLATTALLAGRPRAGLIERAVELAEVHEPPRLGRWPSLFLARHCLWGGELARARDLFESMRALFSSRGVEFQRPYRLSDLALVEVAAGELDRAALLLEDALEAALDARNRQAAVWHHYPAGLVAAHRGEASAADRAADLLTWGNEHHQPPRRLMGHHVLGLAALARGEAAAADGALGAGIELAAALGHRHPGFVPVLPDAVEARALVGDVAGCRTLVEELEAQAAVLGRPWVDAAARRARGLALLVAGDDGAAAVLEAAAADFDRLGYRLDAARARLVQARALRRAGRRGDAATVLDAVEGRFAEMGARPWRDQALAERARLVRSPGATLTATEQRVVELVLLGRRNREIAGELFVSVATVEAHLTRVYRKLAVRSRTELARVLRAPDPP